MQPTLMEGVPQEVDSALKTELAHGIGLMNFDCLDAELELSRDLLIAVALRHKTEHFGFATGYNGSAPPSAFSFLCGKRRGKMVGEGWVDVLLPASGGANGAQQLGV